MSPASQAANPPDCYVGRLHAALQSFPSPASGSLDSPTLGKTLTGNCTSAQRTPQSWLPDAADIVLTLPGDVNTAQVITPLPTPTTNVTESDMELIVGGALAPVHTSPRRQPPLRIGPPLRLPSFEALGIAAPHPDRFGLSRLDGVGIASQQDLVELFPGDVARPFHDVGGRGGGASDSEADIQACKSSGGRATLGPVHQFLATLTPPAEGGAFDWNSLAKVALAPMDSPFSTLSVNSAPASGSDVSAFGDIPRVSFDGDNVKSPTAWIDGAIESIRTLL